MEVGCGKDHGPDLAGAYLGLIVRPIESLQLMGGTQTGWQVLRTLSACQDCQEPDKRLRKHESRVSQ